MNWFLLLTSLMIIITVFTLVFSFNSAYNRRIRILLKILSLFFLIITIYLIYLVFSYPLLGL